MARSAPDREFSEVDDTDDLKAIDGPTLIIHDRDNQFVPIRASADWSADLVRGATHKVYEGGGHGFVRVDAERFNAAPSPP